ncbi:MAG TPA: LamG-like jellyroll fold domain-containing protein [Gemmatimonadales bacterium]|nr:LamG-like jellyroll fold domain-containing protein [Gemmatimonadales bacterium]
MRARAAFQIAVVATVLASCTRDLPVAPSPFTLQASVQGPDAEPNSTCPTAQNFGTLALPFTLNGSLDGSQVPGGGDVDFVRFIGTPSTAVRVDLEGQSTGNGTLGDPFLGWFDSGCNLIAFSDDNGSNLNSRLLVTIPSDGVFILAVTRCCDFSFDQGGAGTYQLNIKAILPPSNDDFLNATSIGSLPFSDPVDLSAATTQTGELTPSCGVPFGPVSKTVWYTFTPTETRSVLASNSATFSTVVGVYTGSSLDALTEVSCRTGNVAFNAAAGTTYHILVGGLFNQGGLLEFHLGDTPSPVAGFGFNPFDPSVFDVVQFFDFSFDSAGVGIQSQQWQFGDGATGTGCCPTHKYGADGDYSAQLTITTFDGRAASTSQPVSVRTHDVAITKLSAPTSASAGQSRAIVVGIKNKRYPETVEVLLFKSVPGGFQSVGGVTKSVPLSSGNSTTSFDFSYTFTTADASIGKVTFKAVANLIGARDALPADNEAIAPPTKVSTNVAAVRCLRPPAGLKGWWPGDGNTRDIIGGNDGTIEADVTFAAAKVLEGFGFGAAGAVIFGGTGVDDLQQLTIDAWVKHNSLPPGRIERYVSLFGNKAVLRYDGGNGPAQLHFFMGINGQLQHIRVNNVLQVGVFHHVAGSYDGSVMRLYLDGVEVGNQPVTGTVDRGSGGFFSSGDESLDGLLDEVHIFDRALTASEVRAIVGADAAGMCKKGPGV